MKILFISSPSFADCDFPLIREFQQLGHNVTYLINLTNYNKRSTLFDIKSLKKKDGIYPADQFEELARYGKYLDLKQVYIVNRTIKQQKFPQNFWLNIKIARLINIGNFDVVHTDMMLSDWATIWFKCHKNFVLTVHDPFPHSGENCRHKNRSYKRCMRLAHKFVLLNKSQSSEFINKYNLQESQVFQNDLGIYNNILSYKKDGLEEVKNSVLYFGRISPYKGIEYLCQAMKKVIKHLPNATLTIAGGGTMYFDTTTYESDPHFVFLNHYIEMRELAERLQKATVVVCPYTDATQSGVIMTSFALGKPVIATNVGGLSEMIENGKTGLLVPPKNADALAEAIMLILQDEKMRKNMSQQIFLDFSEGAKSWRSIAKKYIDIYSK